MRIAIQEQIHIGTIVQELIKDQAGMFSPVLLLFYITVQRL